VPRFLENIYIYTLKETERYKKKKCEKSLENTWKSNGGSDI
jgi:hypothetical protein